MEAYRDQYATMFNNGNKVTLVGISTDPDTMLAAWAKEERFPFLVASDAGAVVGKLYAVADSNNKINQRSIVVIDPRGIISYEMRPFRILAAEPYAQLDSAVDRTMLRVGKDRQ